MKTILTVGTTTVVLPLLGLIIGRLFSFIDKEHALEAMVLVGAISILILCSVIALTKLTFIEKGDEFYDKHLSKLRALIIEANRDDANNNNNNKYITNSDEVKKYESLASEVWVATPDFYWDYENDTYRKVVRENIERGVKYFYLFPDVKIATAQYFKRSLGDNVSLNVHFISVQHSIVSLFQYEIVIIDPEDPESLQHSGFITDIAKRHEESVDFKIRRDLIPAFVLEFRRLMEQYPEI